MRPPNFTKSSSRSLPNLSLREGLSILLVIVLVSFSIYMLLTQLKVSEVVCINPSGQACNPEIIAQVQSLLGTRIFFSYLADQLNSHNSGLIASDIAITLPGKLSLTIQEAPPLYFLLSEERVQAVTDNGTAYPWTNSTIPDATPKIELNSSASAKVMLVATTSSQLNLHTHLVKLLSSLTASKLAYTKLELLDSQSLKIWLNDDQWAIIDLLDQNAISSLASIISHPDFKSQANSAFQLDLRFQYPVLLKSD